MPTEPTTIGKEIQEMCIWFRIWYHNMDMVEEDASRMNTCYILKSLSPLGAHVPPKAIWSCHGYTHFSAELVSTPDMEKQ